MSSGICGTEESLGDSTTESLECLLEQIGRNGDHKNGLAIKRRIQNILKYRKQQAAKAKSS